MPPARTGDRELIGAGTTSLRSGGEDPAGPLDADGDVHEKKVGGRVPKDSGGRDDAKKTEGGPQAPALAGGGKENQ